MLNVNNALSLDCVLMAHLYPSNTSACIMCRHFFYLRHRIMFAFSLVHRSMTTDNFTDD